MKLFCVCAGDTALHLFKQNTGPFFIVDRALFIERRALLTSDKALLCVRRRHSSTSLLTKHRALSIKDRALLTWDKAVLRVSRRYVSTPRSVLRPSSSRETTFGVRLYIYICIHTYV